jgi:DME family drug/metabolite transporter
MVSHTEGRLRGVLFAMAAALTWSSAGVAIKLLPLTALSIAGYRSLFALPVLIGVLLLRTEAAREGAFYRFALRQPTVLVGALAYALCVTLFVQATKLTTAANAILFQYSAPIYTALLSWPLLGERVRGADWLAVLGCSCGMALCFAEKLSSGGALGNVLAMLSGLGFALLPLMWRKQLSAAVQDLEPRPGEIPPRYRLHLPEVTLVVGNLITALVTLPSLVSDPPHSAASWIGVALLGSVQIGLA